MNKVVFAAAFIFTLTQADQGQTIKVKTGNKIVIQLPANLSTGYSWVLAKDYDEYFEFAPLQFKDDVQRKPLDRKEPKTGTPSIEIIEMKPIKAGTVELELLYKRPWEKKNAKTFKVKVIILP